MIICLAGFSGSGKSTLVRRLQNEAPGDWNFSDLDDLVLLQLQNKLAPQAKTLGAAIEQVGLEKFRCAELQVLRETLAQFEQKNLVLALGGGTLGRAEKLIAESCDVYLVALDVSFETCWSRISQDQNRPLTALGKERMYEKFTRRRSAWLQADLILGEEELLAPPSLQALAEKLRAH